MLVAKEKSCSIRLQRDGKTRGLLGTPFPCETEADDPTVFPDLVQFVWLESKHGQLGIFHFDCLARTEKTLLLSF